MMDILEVAKVEVQVPVDTHYSTDSSQFDEQSHIMDECYVIHL